MPDRPWYRWRFSLPLIAAIALFLYVAQSFAADTTAPPHIRILGAGMFALAASGGVWLQWREIRTQRRRINREAATPGEPGG